MQISSLLCITSRLLPGCRIGGADISIEYNNHKTGENRQYYHWRIDLPDGSAEFEGHDLASGYGGGTLQEGLESLLTFLGAFAEANRDTSDDWEPSGNANLFPLELAEWAIRNQDTISAMELELQENPGRLIVE